MTILTLTFLSAMLPQNGLKAKDLKGRKAPRGPGRATPKHCLGEMSIGF